MAIVTTDSKHYSNIADAIREKSGYLAATYKPEDMPSGIDRVYTVGYDKGNDDGFYTGHEAGYEMGKQDGAQSEYDRFWDALQQNGNRTGYNRAFCDVWSPAMFRPKYDLVVDSAYSMFNYFCYGCGPVSLKQLLLDAGVSLVMQNPYNINNMFAYSTISEIGELDFSTATRKNCTDIFGGCSALVTIDKLTFPIGQTNYDWFDSCSALENISIGGEISGNGLNLQWSTKLTHDSLMSIINALADNSSTGTTMTVTLGTENLAKLTDAEKAMATQKGWTLA